MYCEHCGKKLREGARFCDGCGFKVKEEPVLGEAEKKDAAVTDETAMFNEISEALNTRSEEEDLSDDKIADNVEAILYEEEDPEKEELSDIKLSDAKDVIKEPDNNPDLYIEQGNAMSDLSAAEAIMGDFEYEQTQAYRPVYINEENITEAKQAAASSAGSGAADETVFIKKDDISKASEESGKTAENKAGGSGAESSLKPERISGEVVDEKYSRKGSAVRTQKTAQSSFGAENAARGALSSVWVLLGILALLAQTVLMLIYTFSEKVDEALNFIGRLFFFQPKALLYLRLSVSILAVIEIIMIVGFLLAYISAARKKHPFKTAGLSILQVLCAAGLIIWCFAGLCAVGASLVGLRYVMHYYFISFEGISAGQIAYVSAMLAVLVIVYILILIFFAKLVSSLGRAKKAASCGKARKNIALYNAVMLIAIAAVITAFAVVSLFTNAPSSPMVISGELCLAFSCVMYAVFMIKYRRKMKEFI